MLIVGMKVDPTHLVWHYIAHGSSVHDVNSELPSAQLLPSHSVLLLRRHL
jgi:hypothetical protein